MLVSDACACAHAYSHNSDFIFLILKILWHGSNFIIAFFSVNLILVWTVLYHCMCVSYGNVGFNLIQKIPNLSNQVQNLAIIFVISPISLSLSLSLSICICSYYLAMKLQLVASLSLPPGLSWLVDPGTEQSSCGTSLNRRGIQRHCCTLLMVRTKHTYIHTYMCT